MVVAVAALALEASQQVGVIGHGPAPGLKAGTRFMNIETAGVFTDKNDAVFGIMPFLNRFEQFIHG
ncbi:MAG TPA: hypothetical protein PKE63_02890 [Lacibacter sp.]|nr:hypothetical protein [Lacibacter sp.]